VDTPLGLVNHQGRVADVSEKFRELCHKKQRLEVVTNPYPLASSFSCAFR
jgi:hypothetical protein